MFASLLVLASSFLSSVLAQDALTINTPTPAPVFCEPTLIQWSGGTPPYFIAVVDGDDRTNVLVNFGQLSNNSITWEVTEPVGQSCLFTVKDNTGLTQTSALFTIQGGGPTNCLATSSSSGSSSVSKTGSTSSPKSSSKVASTSSTLIVTKTTTTPPATSATSPAVTPSPSSTPASSSASNSTSAAPTSSAPSGAAPTTAPAAAAAAVAAAIGAVFAALV